MKNPSKILLESRRCIDEFSQVELLTDLTWDEEDAVWYFSIQVHQNFEGKNIPMETVWYVTVQDIFPDGKVKIFPAVNGGITDTFYHQSNNGIIAKNGLWREGDICLKDPLESVADINSEPVHAMERMRWNIIRLLEWIDKAENDALVSMHDNFELPDVVELQNKYIIFNEDCVSFMQWEDAGAKLGTFKMYHQGNNQYFIDSFWDMRGTLCVQNEWGGYVDKNDKYMQEGIWIILDQIPVINRWQAPNTIAELKEVLGILWDSDIVRLLDKIRDGKRHLFLIGFPIPKLFGGETKNYHWWSWMLPVLSHHNKTQKGFRPNKIGWYWRDCLSILKDDQPIDWCFSENWNQRQILNRGMFDREVTKKSYAIIGAGSLGSAIAELLVRSGVWRILLIDGDTLSVGNLARHTLGIKNLNHYKAHELQKHLEEINGHVRAKAVPEYLSGTTLNLLNPYDVIIDCTAKDSVINLLSQIKLEKIFLSVSVGYKAERAYFSYHKGRHFNSSMFDSRLEDMTKKDKEQMKKDGLPWDGVGCWNPVFPALACDMHLAATSAVEMFVQLIAKKRNETFNCIFQKKYGMDGLFAGYERI